MEVLIKVDPDEIREGDILSVGRGFDTDGIPTYYEDYIVKMENGSLELKKI